MIEEQNNALVDDLANKVASLKELSINIGEHVREDNRFLSEMDRDMGRTTGMLDGTIGKIGNMMKNGGSQHMCYLASFIVFVFFVLYWVIGKH
jgi:blocked-early-in-transport protein 1